MKDERIRGKNRSGNPFRNYHHLVTRDHNYSLFDTERIEINLRGFNEI